MKIGAFAKSIGLSVMTIRYYMSEGLLLPEKNGSQWEFTAREARDMAMIQDMRACGFSVQNIKRLLTLYRGSSPDLIAERKIIGEEYQKLLEERKATEQAITLLKGAIEEICPPPEESAPCCIPFSLFKLIACPYCRGVLHWNSVAGALFLQPAGARLGAGPMYPLRRRCAGYYGFSLYCDPL